jgi:hypothetical protein
MPLCGRCGALAQAADTALGFAEALAIARSLGPPLGWSCLRRQGYTTHTAQHTCRPHRTWPHGVTNSSHEPAASLAVSSGGGGQRASGPSFRRTTRGEVSAEPRKKPTFWPNHENASDLERVGGACGDIRGPRLGRRAHGEGSDRPRRRSGRKPGWGASLGGRCGRLCGRLLPSLFGRGRRDAPPRSGETGGKG